MEYLILGVLNRSSVNVHLMICFGVGNVEILS